MASFLPWQIYTISQKYENNTINYQTNIIYLLKNLFLPVQYHQNISQRNPIFANTYPNDYAMPLVSVLMPVYNGEKYIKEAIDSILCQTFTDFELLICNDASTDRSMKLVRQYKDPRIKILENPTNLGIVDTRNKLFMEAQGTYLSIMDCDDIAHKQKLEKQVSFLEKHPACGVCGTWARKINEHLQTVGHIQMPEEDADIRINLLFQSSFVQSSVIIRKNCFPICSIGKNFP